MKTRAYTTLSKAPNHAIGSLRCGLMTALGLLMTYGTTATAQSADTNNAAKSLESVLQKAAEKGLLEKKPLETSPRPAENITSPAAVNTPQGDVPAVTSVAANCKLAARADIVDAAAVISLDDLNTAKSQIGTETRREDIDKVILIYLALGLGTEAEALSERNEASLQVAMARVVTNEATAEDRERLKGYEACNDSFKIWSLAAKLGLTTKSSLSTQSASHKITVSELEILSKFPTHLREILELRLAEYAAETGDFLTAETLLKNYAPEIKYGEIPERKDDQLLYIHALILQNKADARAVTILTHIGASQGEYRTKAIQSLADISAQTGLSLPETFESELAAIDDQYGDSQNGKSASLELIKFRADKNKFHDSIKTAKLKFSDTDPLRLTSVTLIGDRVIDGLSSQAPARQLYALNGYFYDPEFFAPYPRHAQLTLQAHSSARGLGFPELAAKLTPNLERYAKDLTSDELEGVDILSNLKLAKAELALKNDDFKQAVETLEPIKTAKEASALRQKASLASQDRDLVQRVLSEQPTSETRDKSYLEFALQEGQWAEAKIFASNMQNNETAKDMPFSLNAEKLNYLSAPLNSGAAEPLPNSTAELEAMLADIRNNTRVAKGLLNHAQTETYAP